MFSVLIACVAWASLVAQFIATEQESLAFAPLGTAWDLARYFTLLTNLLVALSFAVMTLTDRMLSPAWLGGLTLWIGIVGGVYWALLAQSPKGLEAWANQGLHTAVPLLTVLFWIKCAPKHGLHFGTALVWMLWPLAYFLYAIARGQVDGVYPYFFTDPASVGWDGVARWFAILCAAFVAAGGVQVGIARLIRS
ncbi:hypothetical protein GCM10011415_18510 [Salipiger pallidus]|uniref:FAR-17a/AIG1-like protein n=1 Tax=Salipiger pallidus TaxID=1775170 RepID=A0A8J2ZJQ1_9RHOB|nr:hypothetical protein GCM10011415_18510 [Salipiger pallidus]